MLFEKFANDLSCSEQKQYMLAEANILKCCECRFKHHLLDPEALIVTPLTVYLHGSHHWQPL